MPDVTVSPCGSYDAKAVYTALERALEPLGGLDWVLPGMRIAIKANLVTAARPGAAATTHPALLTALTRLLKARGATVVIGDSPGGPYTAAFVNHVYAAAGLSDCEAAGAQLNSDFSQSEARFDAAVRLKRFVYTAYLDHADAIINVCKLKSHGMMGMSAAVKNLFGTIPGTVKPEYHFRFPEQRAFANMLVDLSEFFQPRLCIADAIVAMEGNGPTRGTPRRIGCLLASRSPYALDLCCARLIGLTADDVPTLRVAFERGLSPQTAESLEILFAGSGGIAPGGAADFGALCVPDFERSKSSSDLQFQNRLPGVFGTCFAAVAKWALSSVPACKRDACTGCGKCASICPAGAITMAHGRPVVRRKDCIRCFCCQEFCPAGAMRVKRPLPAQLLGGRQAALSGRRLKIRG